MWAVVVVLPLAWAAPPAEPALSTLAPIKPPSPTPNKSSSANVSDRPVFPPVKALFAPVHTLLLKPLTTHRRPHRKLVPLPMNIELSETWPPLPPRPLEAGPPTVARPPKKPSHPAPKYDSADIDVRSLHRNEIDKKKKKIRKRTEQIEKLAKYVKKHKKILKQLLKVKNERSNERINKAKAALVSIEMAKYKPKDALRVRGDRPHMRGSDIDDVSSEIEKPKDRLEEQRAVKHDEQFDLLFARGGAIGNMRVKGRICQRSILNSEGPKYKRSGVAYRGEFVADKHEFKFTRPPSLLLPRCCNCCKKSVLGCE